MCCPINTETVECQIIMSVIEYVRAYKILSNPKVYITYTLDYTHCLHFLTVCISPTVCLADIPVCGVGSYSRGIVSTAAVVFYSLY